MQGGIIKYRKEGRRRDEIVKSHVFKKIKEKEKMMEDCCKMREKNNYERQRKKQKRMES